MSKFIYYLIEKDNKLKFNSIEDLHKHIGYREDRKTWDCEGVFGAPITYYYHNYQKNYQKIHEKFTVYIECVDEEYSFLKAVIYASRGLDYGK